MNFKYRGYDVEKSDKTDKWYQISLNGKILNVQSTKKAAYDWIDKQLLK